MNRRNFIEGSTMVGASAIGASTETFNRTEAKTGICRKILSIDNCNNLDYLCKKVELNAIRYEADPNSVSFVLGRDRKINKLPARTINEYDCDAFHLPVFPQIESEYEEDKKCVELLCACSNSLDNAISGDITPKSFGKAFKFIEDKDLLVHNVVMHPDNWELIKVNYNSGNKFDFKDCVDFAWNDEMIAVGSVWTAMIYLHNDVPRNKIFFTPDGPYFGVVNDSPTHYCMGVIHPKYMSTLNI